MFEISQQCVIEHVNVRRGKNDESEVAIDIKFSAEDVPAKVVAYALRADKVSEVTAAFFADDKEKNKRFLGMGWIPIDEEWEGKHQIKISSLPRLLVVKLAKIKAYPRGGGNFDLEFRITVEQPPENYIEAIADKIHRSAPQVNLTQTEELDLKPQKETAKVTKSEPQQQALN